MKINFDAPFREVNKLLSRAPASEAGQGFRKVLADLYPRQAEPQGRSDAATSTPMAALNPTQYLPAPPHHKPPDQLLPDLERKPIEPVPMSESQDTGVKSPTLLSARRIDTDPFEKLSRSERLSKIREIVQEAGRKHGIDPALSMAVIAAESNFNPLAVSSDGHFSKGLMQLLDSTSQTLMERADMDQNYTPFDPGQNVELGVAYLRYLHQIFSRQSDLPNNSVSVAAANSSSLEKLALAAYNAGEGRVASAQSRAQRDGRNPAIYEEVEAYLPETTREYVQRVLASKERFEGSKIG